MPRSSSERARAYIPFKAARERPRVRHLLRPRTRGSIRSTGLVEARLLPYHRRGQGGLSIRVRTPLVAALVAAPLLLLQAAPSNDPIVVLLEGERREVAPVIRGGGELLPIGALLPALGISATTDARGGSVTLTFEGRQVILYDKK